MAVELEKFIRNQLDSLPSDHPDRKYLEDLLVTTKSYIERAGGGVSAFVSVEQAVEEYQSKPHTPELVTKVHKTIWHEREELVGKTYEVPPCPYTQENLTELEQQGERVGYLPKELATQQRRYILGKMFPKMRSDSVQKGNPVTNDKSPFGWFDYEVGIDTPYLDTTEKQLTERIAKEGRELLSLNQYIVASQDSKLLTGQYLDELITKRYLGTSTRLGSRFERRVVNARFSQDGVLGVHWPLDSHESYNHGRHLGGRSSGVKRT